MHCSSRKSHLKRSPHSFFAPQIARAQEVKDHFLHQQLKKAKEQREKGELRATGGILGLGLIDDGAESSGSSGSGGKEADSPKSS